MTLVTSATSGSSEVAGVAEVAEVAEAAAQVGVVRSESLPRPLSEPDESTDSPAVSVDVDLT